MDRVCRWNQQLTGRALDGLGAIGGITIYGPRDPARRTSLVAFNLAGKDPVRVAQALNQAGVESRAGCHCATLAHHALGLTPPASCRLSFYLYNTPDEVDHAVAAVAAIATGRDLPAGAPRVLPGRPPRTSEQCDAGRSNSSALRSLQAAPGRVLGQPHPRQGGPAPLVPGLLQRAGPG